MTCIYCGEESETEVCLSCKQWDELFAEVEPEELYLGEPEDYEKRDKNHIKT